MAALSPLALTVLGAAAALCTLSSFVPQILKILKERDASSVSLRTYALTTTAFALWSVYGLGQRAWPLVAANLASLVLAGVALACKWRFRNGPEKPGPA